LSYQDFEENAREETRRAGDSESFSTAVYEGITGPEGTGKGPQLGCSDRGESQQEYQDASGRSGKAVKRFEPR
jgi:hypothetical protein